MKISRRGFLGIAGSFTLGMMGLRHVFANTNVTNSLVPLQIPYGPLLTDPNNLLDLPEGFSYHIFSKLGEIMDDGLLVPGKHDGMASFPGPDDTTILIRNHELEPKQLDLSPFGKENQLLEKVDLKKLYDAGRSITPGLGGTTTLIYDTKNKRLLKHFLSLAGTHRNCAGGRTPWNSWVTCEETVQQATETIEKNHGYNFEVPVTTSPALADPTPLKEMGRFNHEAIAVDPGTGVVYQTEDRADGLIYRYIPKTHGKLHEGGKLQALKFKEIKSADTRNWQAQLVEIGKTYEVEWIDLDDIDSPEDDLRMRGFENGAARFARAEGMWYDNGTVFFACTNGGILQKGQIWKLTPAPKNSNKSDTLELFIQPDDGNLVENADNLTVAPWGDLILCEDNASKKTSKENHLVCVTPKGQIYHLGRTLVSEFAGATFSPDGTTLFVNIQSGGVTLAITGPWKRDGFAGVA